jgi:uncharacterized coiled-coil DUF342 family protein
MQNLF